MTGIWSDRLDHSASEDLQHGAMPQTVTLRSLAVGLILIIAISIFATDTTYRLRASRVSLGHLPICLWLPFLLLFLSNVLLKGLRPHWALRPHELGFILCLGFIGSIFPTKSLAGRLVAGLSILQYKANPENRWGEIILQHLKPWAIPGNEIGAITYLWEGLPQGQGIPWRVWAGPLFWWFTLFFALFIASLCLTVIFRKQWVEHERIVFPLARLPIMMITDEEPGSIWPRFFRSRLFWIGFGIALFIILWNILPRFSHRVPIIPIGPTYGIKYYYAKYFPPVKIKFNFFVATFGYLTNLEVLLSIWFFHILALIEAGALNRLGVSVRGEYSSGVMLQQVGGFITLVFVGLYIARKHITAVFRTAWRPGSGEDDREELLSYRATVIGLLVSLVYSIGWMHAFGISLIGVVVQVGFLLIYFLGLAKIVAETGLVYVETPLKTQQLSAAALGPIIQTSDHIGMALSANTVESHRAYILPTLTHLARIHHSFRWDRTQMLGSLCVAFLIGFVVSVAYTLVLCYTSTGASNIRHVYVFNNYGPRIFNRVVRWASEAPSFTQTELIFIAAGAIGTLLLSFLRLRLPWWPLHPVGFTVASVFMVNVTAFTVFLVWAFKALVLRIGGVAFYRRLQPFFLGLLFGYTLGVGLSTLVDAIWFPGNGHPVHGW